MPEAARTDRGWGRLLVLVYAVFAVAATGRSTVQLAQNADEAPLAYALSAFAAVVYLVATWTLARPGLRATRVAWAAVGVELAGVLLIGTLSLWHPEVLGDDTVWSRYGARYGYVPLVLPVAGLAWLAHTRRGLASRPGRRVD
ncbi:hypothetical protein K8W59_00510 [Nocardioides rotundus]|uniref:hypothetical protein n=1 Tax=Nocardioides rotundus TaxID=1774216 RepID=UPI001CBA72DE|nr:hypothetical protein [Nocardioides rotundus]UAL30079.1 hypothetical protein K8W59_00510 [Nocardioides rotundus]